MQKPNKLVELSHLGLLRVHGVDAKTFLQGQVTCNLDDITLSQSRLAAHCNLKGRIQSLFRLFAMEQTEGSLQYFLSLPLSMLGKVQQNFKKYALFSKVQIEDCSTHFTKLGICGDFPQFSSLEINSCVTQNSDEGSVSICRIPGLQPRYEIIGHPNLINAFTAEIEPTCEKISSPAWELWDIEAGLPTVLPATVDQFLPHHVNLIALNGISFSKGCYLGQEVVARMHYRGKIKKHMYHVLTQKNSGALAGDPIFVKEASSSEAPGNVVRVGQSEKGDHLLVVLDEQYAAFENVTLNSSEGVKLSLLGV